MDNIVSYTPPSDPLNYSILFSPLPLKSYALNIAAERQPNIKKNK